MSQAKKPALPKLTDLASLLARSIPDEATGCLHLLKHTGERIPVDGAMPVVLIASGVYIAARRFAWQVHNGQQVPKGLMPYHTCQSHDCVAKAHLRVGTKSDLAISSRSKLIEEQRRIAELAPKPVPVLAGWTPPSYADSLAAIQASRVPSMRLPVNGIFNLAERCL